ncbi:hypothetical protein QL285_002426 [Trifolium repens]|nr:hypothetical protein QL285_002426 [Trifolium repens]
MEIKIQIIMILSSDKKETISFPLLFSLQHSRSIILCPWKSLIISIMETTPCSSMEALPYSAFETIFFLFPTFIGIRHPHRPPTPL